jgi:glycosyltransferase involved in cell wall biosynthesis
MDSADVDTPLAPDDRRPRLYLECSMTAASQARTGIQRVVRNVAAHMKSVAEDAGWESRPVLYRDGRWLDRPDLLDQANARFSDARKTGPPTWSRRVNSRLRKLFYPRTLVRAVRRAAIAVRGDGVWTPDFRAEDVLLLLDGSWTLPEIPRFHAAKRAGTRIGLVVYDLLPIQYPHFMVPKATRQFRRWMEEVTPQVDFFVAISRAVRDEFRDWLRERFPNRGWDPECVSWFPLGADLQLDVDATGTAVRSAVQEAFSGSAPTFVKVCTLDPRKNHASVLDAFEPLWANHANPSGNSSGNPGGDVVGERALATASSDTRSTLNYPDATKPRLVFLGRRGWMNAKLFERLDKHPLRGRQLFWFDDASDAELQYAYRHAQASIFASFAEGFGLPIIESLGYGLPTFVSDIPVHREVGGDYCEWFDPKRPSTLTSLIDRHLREGGTASRRPPSEFRIPTWDEAARRLFVECRQRASRTPPRIADSAGPGDRGPRDRGPGDRGPGDRGPGDRGPGDRGPGDRGPGDRGLRDRETDDGSGSRPSDSAVCDRCRRTAET